MDDTKNFFEELAAVGSDESSQPEKPSKKTKTIDLPINPNDSEPADTVSNLAEEREGQLTIDVYQTPEAIIIESPIAGVSSDELEINVTSESVTIRGQRDRVRTIKDSDYFYQECYWGRFSRSVILPQEIDPDKSEATIKNGVLTLTMPKVTRQKQKRVKVSKAD